MPEIRQIFAEDYGRLAVFLAGFAASYPPAESWLARFRHWWDANPAFSAGIPRGWAIEDKTGGIAGFLGSIPSFLHLPGRSGGLLVFSATTWNVLPAFRSHSLKLLEKFLESSHESIAFDSTPSPDVLKILSVLKFRRVTFSRKTAYRLLDPVSLFLGRYSGNLAGRLLSGSALPKLLAADWFLRFGKAGGKPDPAVRLIDTADSTFDRLWEQTRQSCPGSCRDARTLGWYCFGNPEGKKILIGYYRGDELLGYAIFRSGQKGSAKSLVCLDVFTLPGCEWVSGPLLDRGEFEARKLGCALLTVLVPLGPAEKEITGKFLLKKNREFAVYFKAGPEYQKLIAIESLHLYAQGDHGL
ncbi:MAG: hypothetical protein V1794_03680 [Candidatus Glassbacteria bacterium]